MKVIKPFTCKVTKIRYEAGSDYTGARGAELAEKGFLEADKEKAEVTHISKEADIEPTKKRTRRK
jgi:hypothetical protein